MTEEKKMKIEFAPGCFDHFDGTQEELDELMQEITTMFTELTPEELEARSKPVFIEDLIEDDELTEEQLEQILHSLVASKEKRNLQ